MVSADGRSLPIPVMVYWTQAYETCPACNRHASTNPEETHQGVIVWSSHYAATTCLCSIKLTTSQKWLDTSNHKQIPSCHSHDHGGSHQQLWCWFKWFSQQLSEAHSRALWDSSSGGPLQQLRSNHSAHACCTKTS